MAKTAAGGRVQSLTEGINSNVSDSLTRPGEVLFSTNAKSDKVGVLLKAAGQASFWDLGSANPVTNFKLFNTDVYGIIGAGLYKKGTGLLGGITLVANSPLAVANKEIFYVKSDYTLGAYDGSAVSADNLTNAPVGSATNIPDVQSANGKLYAIIGTKAYISSPPRRLVGTVVSDHVLGSTTINVSSTRYIRVGNVLEFWTIGITAMKYLATVTAVTSSTAFTVAALAIQSAVTFTGAGLDDETVTSTGYTGTTRKLFEVDVFNAAANPDQFKWRVDGGSWSSAVNMAVADTTLQDGVKIKWAAVNGHTDADRWAWYETPGTLANGDEIYYTGMKTQDIYMWNDDPNVGSWFEVSSDTGTYIGMIEQLGTVLFFFPSEIKRFDESTLSTIAKKGTKWKKTIQLLGKRIFFANNLGIYMIEGNTVTKVSQKMDPYFAGISDSSVMAAGVDDNKYRLYIGTCTYPESNTGVEIVLDTDSMKFDIRTGIDSKGYAELIDGNVYGSYLGTSLGKVLKIGSGTSNDGTEIPFYIRTVHDDLGHPNHRKLLERVIFRTVPGSILDVSYSLDRGEYKPLGQITEQVQSFDLSDIRCGTISLGIGETSSDTAPGVLEYSIEANVDEEV